MIFNKIIVFIVGKYLIYWDNNSKKYEPDLIVETVETVYMVETTALNNLNDPDVQAKKGAAERYCNMLLNLRVNMVKKYGNTCYCRIMRLQELLQ